MRTKGDFYGAAIGQLIRDTDEEVSRMDAAQANRRERVRVDSELTVNLSKLTTTAAMEDPRFLEMMQVVERHAASGSAASRSTPRSREERQRDAREAYLVMQLSKMLRECLTPTVPAEFKKLTRTVHDWYRAQGLARAAATTPRAGSGPGASREAFPAAESRHFSVTGQHPAPAPRRGIHFADDNRKEENVLPPPRQEIPDTVVDPIIAGTSGVDVGHGQRGAARSRGGGGARQRPDSAGHTGAPDPYKTYDMHEVTEPGFVDALESSRGQRKERWQQQQQQGQQGQGQRGQGHQYGGGASSSSGYYATRAEQEEHLRDVHYHQRRQPHEPSEHELFIRMKEHMEEVDPEALAAAGPGAAVGPNGEPVADPADPLGLRPRETPPLSAYASRSLAGAHEARQLLALARARAEEPTEEEKLAEASRVAAEDAAKIRPEDPEIRVKRATKIVRDREREIQVRELTGAEAQARAALAPDPRAASPRRKGRKGAKKGKGKGGKGGKGDDGDDPNSMNATGRTAIPEDPTKLAEAAEISAGDAVDPSAGGGEGASAATGEGGAAADGAGQQGQDGDAAEGLNATRGAANASGLFPENPEKPRLERRTYAPPEVLDVMNTRWAGKRHQEASEKTESAAVKDVLRMWQMHRGRIEEEIVRRQENYRYSYAERPVASRARTPFGVEQGSFNLAVGSDADPLDINAMAGVEPGDGQDPLGDLVDDDDESGSDLSSDEEAARVAESVHNRLRALDGGSANGDVGSDTASRGSQVACAF
jgi:hypothetical protein